MLILFLGLYTVWMWAMLPMFRRYLLLPSSVSKCVGWVSVYIGLCFEKTGGNWRWFWRAILPNMDCFCSPGWFLETNIVTIYVCDNRRGMDSWTDLMTTYTHHWELQVITALSLISTLHKSLAHAMSSPSLLDVSWLQLLTVEMLQLLALRSSYHSRPWRTQHTQLLRHLFSASVAELNWLDCPSRLLYNHFSGTISKTPFFIVALEFVSAGMYLPNRCSETAVCLFAYSIAKAVLVILFRGLCLATGLYATLLPP
jgi:hypothetical protein